MAVGAAPVMRVRRDAKPVVVCISTRRAPNRRVALPRGDHWRYGMNDFVPYVTQQAATAKGAPGNAAVGGLAVALERRYLEHRVI